VIKAIADLVKAHIVLKYDSTPGEDTWWEAWSKYMKAKKEIERAVYELDEEGMRELKQEIKKAWQDEEYEISLKTMDEIVKRYQKRVEN